MKRANAVRKVGAFCAIVLPAAILGLHLITQEGSSIPRAHSNAVLLHCDNSFQIHRPHPLTSAEDAAIVSATTGEIDRPQLRPGPGIFVYREDTEPLPFPRHDVNQRLRAKYFKMSTHWLHPEYPAYIWADGAFQIDDADGLRTFMVDALQSADCAFFPHPNRQTIVEELNDATNAIASGFEYLRVRYETEPMQAQVDAYLAEGFPMDEYPLVGGGLFIRRNLPHVNAAFDHWLIENFKWTIQDQLSLPYILWKHNLTFNLIDGSLWSGSHYKHTGHEKQI